MTQPATRQTRTRPNWTKTSAATVNQLDPDTWQGKPMTTTNGINIDSEWIALARAVIIQAAREAAAGDVDAARWLAADETAETWFTVAGVRRSAVLAWLAKPRIKAGVRKGSAARARSTTSAKITSANKQAVTH